MTDDRELGGRRVVYGLVGALTAVTAAFGGLLGYVLPAWTGLEEVTVLESTVPVSPVTFGLYGGVTIGVSLLAVVFVVQLLSRFDENAV